VERSYFGPDSIVEAEENVAKVRENLKIAQSRQKSYAEKRRRYLSFEVGDHMMRGLAQSSHRRI
jgi:hypothetical protein